MKVISEKAIKCMNAESYADLFISMCANGCVEDARVLYGLRGASEFALKDSFRCACDTKQIESIEFLLKETDLEKDEFQEFIQEVNGYDDEFHNRIQNMLTETNKIKSKM